MFKYEHYNIYFKDERLRKAVAIYGDKEWVRVAEYVGHKVTNERCLHRWTYYVRPELKDRKQGPWSEDEVSIHILLINTCSC